jgi:hypothetical protein
VLNKSELPIDASLAAALVGSGWPAAVYLLGPPVAGVDELNLIGAHRDARGQSGVGKSADARSRCKAMPPSAIWRATRKAATTSTAWLYRLPCGGQLLDAPGVRDFSPAVQQLDAATLGFAEVSARAGQCRFADCRHLAEPGCAVRAASNRARWTRGATSYSPPAPAARGSAGAPAALVAAGAPAGCLVHSAEHVATGSACASVPLSMYSSSPPTGTPCAMRLAACALAHQPENRCGLAFHRRIGRQDHPRTPPAASSARTRARAQLVGTNAIERREVAHQHEEASAVTAGLLDRHHVGWRFDHAHQRRIACRIRADRAQLAPVSMRHWR